MLPRDNRHSVLPSGLLDSPSRAFVRGEMASDGDITRPHNPIPHLELPPGSASQWHVHLELRPEQLVALHRMGFTSGALAWRHGMDRWQPLRDGSDGDSLADADAGSAEDGELEASGTPALDEDGRPRLPQQKVESKRGFAFPRGGAGVPVGLVQATPVSTRPPPPSQDDQVFDEMFGRPLPPPPRMPSSLAPRMPSSLPPRPTDEVLEPPLYSEPQDGDAGRGAPASLALIPRPSWLAQTHLTPVALERPISIPPPAILDAYGGQRAVVRLQTLWFGMGATVVVSAAVAALVSSVVWNLHSRWRQPEPLAENPVAATIETTKPAATKPADEPAEPQPTSVSVDQLPLLSGTRTAAPVTITGSESARTEAREEARAAERSQAAPPRWVPKPAPAPAPPPPVPTPAAAKHPLSAVEASIAARMAEESAPKTAAPQEAPSPPSAPGPADRDSVARAVAQAAAAAKSCSSSPENGQVIVKFAPSGSAQSIQLLKPFSDRDVNGCVLRAMSRARVAPFTGEAVSVRKTLRW